MASSSVSGSAYQAIERGSAPWRASGLGPWRAWVRDVRPGLEPILGVCKRYRLRPLGSRRMVVIFLSPAS